jgi:Uma2 family endonuclease
MTLLEYFNTPETVLPQELIDGAVHAADAPFVSHQRVVLRLAMALQAHLDSGEAAVRGEVLMAPVDVVLDADRPLVLQPDLLFVSSDREQIVLDRVYGPPDLVVEVLSPRPRIGDLTKRVDWFAQYGVREIWLYNQIARELDVLQCRDGRVSSRVSPGSGPIESAVFPELRTTMTAMLGQY